MYPLSSPGTPVFVSLVSRWAPSHLLTTCVDNDAKDNEANYRDDLDDCQNEFYLAISADAKELD